MDILTDGLKGVQAGPIVGSGLTLPAGRLAGNSGATPGFEAVQPGAGLVLSGGILTAPGPTLPAFTLAGNSSAVAAVAGPITMGAGLSLAGGVLAATVAGFDGVVDTYALLPVDGTAPLNAIYLVRQSSGTWLINRHERGPYQRIATVGVLADWQYLGEWLEEFSDANFNVYNAADNTKQFALDLSGITTGTKRTFTVPDQSGTLVLQLGAPQFARMGLGIAADAAIPLRIGALGTVNSVDPQLVISRDINSGTGNAHGFSDSSNFARAGGTAAYCSFDGRITTTSVNNFDHYAAFQALPAFGGSGILSKAYGCVSGGSTSSGTVANWYHHYVQEVSGAGVVTNQYGLYIEPLAKGGTKNYGLFVDTNVSRLNGQIGVNTDPVAGHTLDLQSNSNAPAIFSLKNTDAGAASRADLRLDNGTDLGLLIKAGTGYTLFGLAGDLVLYNSSATGATRIFANSSAVLNCLPSGNVSLPNGSLAFSVSGKGLTGTVAADNASAGVVGELISASVASVASITLATGTQANVTSISLTPGDWDVNGSIYLTLAATTVPAWFLGGVSNVSASAGAILGGANFEIFTTVAPVTDPIVTCPMTRINVSVTTTIYLVIDASFTTSTCKAYGIIRARRVR